MIDKQTKQIDAYLSIIESDPGNVDVLTKVAKFYFEQGDLNKALPICKKIIEVDPNHSNSHNNIGLIYYSQNKYEDAIKSF